MKIIFFKELVKELKDVGLFFNNGDIILYGIKTNGILSDFLRSNIISEFKEAYNVKLETPLYFISNNEVIIFKNFSLKYYGYLVYLFNHKINVMINGLKLVEFLNLQNKVDCSVFIEHDLSKLSEEEYGYYARYFYDDNGKTIPSDIRGQKDDVTNKSFKHHRDNNPHHTEFYYKNDEPQNSNDISDMPFESILDMFSDWKTMSDFYGTNVYEWVEESNILTQMSEKTKKQVISLLNKTEDYFADMDFFTIKTKIRESSFNFYKISF